MCQFDCTYKFAVKYSIGLVDNSKEKTLPIFMLLIIYYIFLVLFFHPSRITVCTLPMLSFFAIFELSFLIYLVYSIVPIYLNFFPLGYYILSFISGWLSFLFSFFSCLLYTIFVSLKYSFVSGLGTFIWPFLETHATCLLSLVTCMYVTRARSKFIFPLDSSITLFTR